MRNKTRIAAAVATAAACYGAWRAVSDTMLADMRGKVVLITGSSRGLGFALAREFAQLGSQLVICGRTQETLDSAAVELQAMGATVLAVRCDVGRKEEVDSLIISALSRFGRIDVLINNAGIITVGPMESQSLDDYEECIDTMFWGTVYSTLAVLPHMIERGEGRIANITSIGGKISVPHLLPYSCAKFAAVGFSEGLRAEVGRHGISVTTVVPGLMRTGSHVNAYFKGDHQKEYTLFALSATSPLTAVPGPRAARRIVRAIRLGRAEVILTPQAHAAALFHGLFPGQTANIAGLINRVLPKAEAPTDRYLGKESETSVTRSPITALGRKQGRRLNQYPEAEPHYGKTGTM